MHDKSTLITARLDRFVRDLLEPAIYRARSPLTVTSWDVPDEPVPFAEARAADFTPFAAGSPWGKPWGTVWFHVSGDVPAEWAEQSDVAIEVLVDIGFTTAQPGFQAEGTVYGLDGHIIKGLEPLNQHIPVTQGPGEALEMYVEAASNPDVPDGQWTRPTTLGDVATAGDRSLYTTRAFDVALLDVPVWELLQDIWTLDGLARVLPKTSPRRAEIVHTLDLMVDAVDPDDVSGTAAVGRAVVAPALARPANASAHVVHAVGHAHIDSAWLWPVRETVRKCARTFSNVLALMDEDEHFTFACSSAQQYAWVKEHFPELFERIRERVAEGRFIPVGGMWVESDTNMPGGEALVRQFVTGKKFFADEFGVEPREVWLPDSFGYTGAFPQIAALAGCENFLTQKISWNDTNAMPHHTFWWEGIDGSRVYTHFPPVDTYNSVLSGEELARAEHNFAEKGRANTSLAPFGFGDGGGGPTREMVAAAHRTRDLEGSPMVKLSSPQGFFDAAREEYPEPPTWLGEMYLEYHRGTYTSQARTKRGNRRSEHLLREAELWATTAVVRSGAEYPTQALDRIWRLVLLQQFHDILPGSSIAWVHREAERNYAAIAIELDEIITTALTTLAGPGEQTVVANATPFARGGVGALGTSVAAAEPRGGSLTAEGTGWVFASDTIRAVFDERGLLTSYVDLASGRETVPAGTVGNLFQLHRDIPNQWEAWDIEQNYRRTVTDLVDAVVVEAVDDRTLRIVREFRASRIEQLVTLADGPRGGLRFTLNVDWHERQKLLKLAFPLDIHTDRATSEIQFGHVHRATHTNTSWDDARFETVAHRWVHVGEPDFGAAIINDSTYGYDVTRSPGNQGSSTTVRLSILRAPLFPDPEADQGQHTLTCELVLGATIADAIEHGYALNLPTRAVTGGAGSAPLVRVSNPAVVVESVKLAEDGSGDVIVRLYESLGGRAAASVSVDFEHTGVHATDLLERPLGDHPEIAATSDDGAPASYPVACGPFQIVTLRVQR
ncbi:alpha-mannosidase [Sanguibacter gelidistatuariae]|uniref:Alpha-mannosidase n=1 Tax=Sanguibacter gelidistatuariae TaxID=1814289 RepID=A0A1G6KX75_9MICO|nr:glycoside hydrolase family 38 C-terminal domain-containing protein [Sanguibacter gelidistatuariae]SDC34986.1 alpha-mannosidase [Sanguibacter gelidistatuariae]